MDEADKYKQRLEAIAEKRRLQEEQDRARREMEEEKLRLQQLKRKSLRDQWLLEGAPLSPTSLDTQSPRSPLWGSQAQEIEKRIDKLQSESQRLAEEEEKLKEQMEGGQMDTVNVAEVRADKVQNAIMENGGDSAAGPDIQIPLVDETAAILTNGEEYLEANIYHDATEQSNTTTTNGPASEGATNMKESGLILGVSEAEPGEVLNVNINEGEEEGTVVMRAERVIITEEEDDLPEELTPEEEWQEAVQLEESPQLNPDADKEGEEAMEEVVNVETAPEAVTQPEESEAAEPAAEAQPPAEDREMEDVIKTNENGDEEEKAEVEDQPSEDPTSAQVHLPADALEGAPVAPMPVYSEALSTLTPQLQAEGEAATSPEGAEVALKVQDPANEPGQFQDVPLADPQENQRTEAGPAEQEPLLLQTKAPTTHAEPAATNSPASAETQSPTGANQEGTESPKHKTCQCCSVM